jgi:hypothetical protein
MRNWLRARWWGVVMLVALAAAVAFPHQTLAQEAAGFDGFVQSGTCEAPNDDVKVDLESDEDYDVMPYLAKVAGGDGEITLLYYGAPEVPGFGFATIFTDEEDFSLVITVGDSDEAVACGDLLEPDSDDFAEAGLALIRLRPVAGSGIQGVASLERTVVQREDDVISARFVIVLFTDVEVAPPAASPEASPVS